MTGNALRSLLVNVGGAGISFIGQVILARAMGQSGFGVYLVALAAMNAVLVLAKLELDGASTRFLSGYLGSGQPGFFRGFASWSRRTVTWSSLTVALLAAAIALLGRDAFARKSPQLPGALLAATGLLVVSAQMMLSSSHLQALKRYVQSQVPGVVVRPTLLTITIGIWYLASQTRPTPTQVILVNIAATTVALLLLGRWLRSARPAEVTLAAPQYERSRWSRAAMGLVAVGISQLVISQQTDLLVVGTLVGPDGSALYGAAGQFTQLLQFGQASITFVAAPMFAELYERRDMARMQHLVRQVFVANAVTGLPILAFLLVFGRNVLRFYGPAYDQAYPVLVLLGLSVTTVAVVGATAGFLLTMTQYQPQAGWIIGGSAVLNLVLTLVLTPRFGLTGTASATLIATVARSGILVWFIKRRMGLSVLPGLPGIR